MIWIYLKEDVIGTASRIVYGRKGDKVYILKNEINMCLVMNESESKFYVKSDLLSSTYIQKETITETIKSKKR